MAAPQYDAIQLDPTISRSADFGPTFSTIVVETVSGAETRISQWLVARHRGTISFEMRTPAQAASLKAFFLARSGRARGFRYKDWSDYTATNEPLIPQPAVNPPAGSPTLQLLKTYSDGLIPYVRNIYAPTASPAAVLLKNGGAFAGYTLDTTTGLVSLNSLNSRSITAIVSMPATVINASTAPLLVYPRGSSTGLSGRSFVTGGAVPPRTIIAAGAWGLRAGQMAVSPRFSSASLVAVPATTVNVGAAHGFAVADLVYFSGVGGMTQINGLVGQVIATTSMTIVVNINSTLFAAYTSGGTATKYLVASDTISWSGQFDTPVRFDTDEQHLVQEDVAILNWESIGIVELVS